MPLPLVLLLPCMYCVDDEFDLRLLGENGRLLHGAVFALHVRHQPLRSWYWT